MLCDRAELCGELGQCTQVSLELILGSECVQGKGLGQQGQEPSDSGEELKKERTRQWSASLCTDVYNGD